METEVPTVHSSHDPEPDDAKFISSMTICRVCMRFVTGPQGVTNRGTNPCSGPAKLRPFHWNS